MKFRPCIDLHDGQVVQIIGESLRDDGETPRVNFVSGESAADYAKRYQRDGLIGGHLISLGSGNRAAAMEALQAFPGGLQYGGGVTPDNAWEFLDAGASHAIVTSYVFSDSELDLDKLAVLRDAVGKERLALDLSCRRRGEEFYVAAGRWQTLTRQRLSPALLDQLSSYCAEFLVHGVDVEGKRQGVQEPLVELLGKGSPLPVTYAGGVSGLSDLELVKRAGQGRVDLTIGSALDIFGGSLPYTQVLEWFRQHG